jgi:hypothetical protein
VLCCRRLGWSLLLLLLLSCGDIVNTCCRNVAVSCNAWQLRFCGTFNSETSVRCNRVGVVHSLYVLHHHALLAPAVRSKTANVSM